MPPQVSWAEGPARRPQVIFCPTALRSGVPWETFDSPRSKRASPARRFSRISVALTSPWWVFSRSYIQIPRGEYATST